VAPGATLRALAARFRGGTVVERHGGMKLAIVVALLTATTAHADPFEQCQALRRQIVANKSCPTEAALANRLFCSAKTYPEMLSLERACFGASRAPRCTVTRVAGEVTWIDVPVHHALNAESWCKTSVRTAAEQWLAEHAWCRPGQTTFTFTFRWGALTFDRTGFCPARRP